MFSAALALGATQAGAGTTGIDAVDDALGARGLDDGSGAGAGSGKGAGHAGDHDATGHDHDCPEAAPRGKSCEAGSDFQPFGVRGDREIPSSPRQAAREAAAPEKQDHSDSDTAGHTTLEQTIVGGDPASGYQQLGLGPGDERIVREELATAQEGREERRISLTYLGHLTDFQLADEESPVRVEFLDAFANPPFPNTVSGAWRPQEAFVAQGADMAIRQMNRFTAASPHSSLGSAPSAFPASLARQKRGRAQAAALDEVKMDAGLMTGDLADNQQYNETAWVVRLLEGGPLDPDSGGGDVQSCGAPITADGDDYAGVQDKGDYPIGFAGDTNAYYDPDDPGGAFADWPIYEGLMDRAQQPFTAAGLKLPGGGAVPTYVSFGNHDGLVQGNEAATRTFEDIGTGCVKPLVPTADLPNLGLGPSGPGLGALGAAEVMIVPPDPDRRFVDKSQFMDLHRTGFQADDHGFGLVDPAEESASNGAAGYYAFDLKPGLRLINIDTLCEGGIAGPAAAGNIDDPQWQWLEAELGDAQEAGKLILLMGHHPIRSLTCNIDDEQAPPCSSDDSHGHDTNPGCDADPRDSSPFHDGGELAELLGAHPNFVAYIAGHTHQQTLSEFDDPGGGSDFWGVETASLVDWPPQTRLIELMDNCDGTLSIMATVLDTEGPATSPEGDELEPEQPERGPVTHAAGFTEAELASLGRTFTYNDPQVGPASGGQGELIDRNVELLLDDPRPEPSAACGLEVDDEIDGGGGEKEVDDEASEGEVEETASSGSLPLTGLTIGGLALVSLALLLGGGLIRRFGSRGA